jgi:hypothetical protein
MGWGAGVDSTYMKIKCERELCVIEPSASGLESGEERFLRSAWPRPVP